MTTVNEVIKDAVEDIGYQSEEEPIQATTIQAGIRYLNDMMALWAGQGINIGYTTVSAVTDVLTVENKAIPGIKANLSVALSGKFKAEIPPSVIKMAKEGYEVIVNMGVPRMSMSYPDILPQGSGNTYPTYNDDAFFPGDTDNINSFISASHALSTLTIAVANTPVILGSWTIGAALNFVATTGGKFTYVGAKSTIVLKAVINLKLGAGTDNCTFYFYKNGSKLADTASQVSVGTTESTARVSVDIELTPNDYLELYVENDDTTEDIIIVSGKVESDG